MDDTQTIEAAQAILMEKLSICDSFALWILYDDAHMHSRVVCDEARDIIGGAGR